MTMEKSAHKHVLSIGFRHAIKFIVLFLFAAFALIPLLWMLITSLKAPKELYITPIQYIPSSFYLGNYISIINSGNFLRYLLNSCFVALIAPALTVLFSTMAAYVLKKVKFKGSGIVMLFILMTQMLPSAGAFAPMYILLSKLGMTDKLYTVILILIAAGIPFSTLMLMGFMSGVPDSLEEAALIDGCGRLKSFFYIVIPLLISGIFTVLIFQFMAAWNDIYTTVLYLNSSSNYTLQVAIYSLIGKYDINWGELSAGTVISLIPVMLLFSVMKDMFVSGITAGAVKG